VARTIKPETDDPVAALDVKSIHERAAAARDLSRFGTHEHLPLLIERAHSDRSPAVRLGCAAAASDILSRLRQPPASQTLSIEERRSLVDLFRGFDPAVNSGLFPILACLGLPELFTRIAAGLRDPRGDVRLGGAVGLLRMVSSATVAGDELMEKRVTDLLSDHRLKPDAVAALAQICAAVGYRSAVPALHRLDLPGAHGEAVSAALDTFTAQEPPLSAAWFSDGRDAGEVNPVSPHGHAFVIITGSDALERSPDGSWSVVSGFTDHGIRRMFIRRVGEPEARATFQKDGRTWHQADLDAIRAQLEAELEDRPVDWAAAARGEGEPALGLVADYVAPLLDETAAPWRDLGLLRALAGDLGGAIQTLNRAVEGKRTPADTWHHLGEALHTQGKTRLARTMWETCVEKSRSKKAASYLGSLARLEETA
jgi:tetratricopeptide (TPR) repeat protein